MAFQYPITPTAEALAAALDDDPFYATLVADQPARTPERQMILARYFAYALDEAAAYGRLTMAEPPGHGAAIWLLPEVAETRRARERAKQHALSRILGARGYACYAAMVEAMETLTAPVIPPNSWYLSILGIAPPQQRRGLGALLLQPTLAAADAQRAPCYLETFGAHTLGFYRRAGFSDLASFVEPLTDARYWVLLRPPRQA